MFHVFCANRIAAGSPDANSLRARLKRIGSQLARVTGDERHVTSARRVVDAMASASRGGEVPLALEAFSGELADLRTLMKNLAYLIAPPPSLSMPEEPSAEVRLLHEVLGVAAHHQDLSRMTRTAESKRLPELAAGQRELGTRCAVFIQAAADSSPHPRLVSAHRHLAAAATKLVADRDAAMGDQQNAADELRAFIVEYARKYVDVPPPAPPQPPAPSGEPPEDGELQLFFPGALTGKKPKGGRQEWQVLGSRDRAALNENFARELPLEYRAILKDYYERLTR